MNLVKWLRVSFLLMLALGLAIPAVAWTPELNDSQEPGSVIVFPKFITGKTSAGDPRSEFEISIVCPKNPDGTPGTCVEGTRVKLRAHWVCPGDQDPKNKYICKETDFDLFSTVFGTIVINPENTGHFTAKVPVPPCERGYLIAWVINTSDQPIKYDALIGDGILREVGSGKDGLLSAYNAIPIQAYSGLANGAVIPTDGNQLHFEGDAGGYKAVTGKIRGTVRYDRFGGPGPPFYATALTLLTLDVNSNRSNFPTFVDLNFYSENEVLVSTFWEFVCWTEVGLSALDPNLTEAGIGSPKGLVVSGPANKEAIFGITDEAGPVTLLGIVETAVYNSTSQAYSYSLYNDSVPVPTEFELGSQAGE